MSHRTSDAPAVPCSRTYDSGKYHRKPCGKAHGHGGKCGPRTNEAPVSPERLRALFQKLVDFVRGDQDKEWCQCCRDYLSVANTIARQAGLRDGVECPRCDGEGKVGDERPCRICTGEGRYVIDDLEMTPSAEVARPEPTLIAGRVAKVHPLVPAKPIMFDDEPDVDKAPSESMHKKVTDALDHVEAVLRDDEVDLSDYDSPASAKDAQLELIEHLRDLLLADEPATDYPPSTEAGEERR